MSFIERSQEQYSRVMAQSEGTERLLRESAWEAFVARGLPTRKTENWRYTNLRLLDTLSPASQPAVELDLPSDIYTIIMVDGVIDPSRSDMEIDGIEVVAGVKSQAAQINPDKHPMAILNLALSDQGLTLHIPAGCVIDKPIALIHQSSAQQQVIRHDIYVGEGAKVSFLSQSSASALTNLLYQLHLSADASCSFFMDNHQDNQGVHLEALHVEQQKGSNLDAFILSKGSRLSRFDITTAYVGPHASSRVLGVSTLNQQQHSDIHLNAEHLAPHCSTVQSVRSVVQDSAKAVFNGRVCVHPNAQKSYSEQSNHNLILSNTCQVNTKPELEIYNDDVKCSHGATVGQLDQEALFYLMARGIEKDEALQMLRQAFLAQQFDFITDPNLKSYLMKVST